MVKYSIIIPAYNCVETLSNTVSSVRKSGLRNSEIILIDDGSVDGTGGLCDQLAGSYQDIRCIHQKNSGVSAARNAGLLEARGEYVLFVDADDSIAENGLADAVEVLEEHRPDMLIFGMRFDYYFHEICYRSDPIAPAMEGLLSKKQVGEQFRELYNSNAITSIWNKFIRRELIQKAEITFRTDMIEMEDFLFSVECLNHCEYVYILPMPIYQYKQAEDEKNTYRRLWRISSLSEYMEPIAQGLTKLQDALAADLREMTDEVFCSLFIQKIQFANCSQIAAAAQEMLRSKYRAAVENRQGKLFDQLKNGKYGIVWLRFLRSRIRHWVAVRVKYLRKRWDR